MQARTIQQCCNDKQYLDNIKDGVSMNERTFISFVKDIIREYGDRIGHSIFITLTDLPNRIQQEYLKQWYFFEGQIEHYQEIFNNPLKIHQALIDEKDSLNYWLSQYVEEIEQEEFASYVDAYDLITMRHEDNGEVYLVRR